jgi:hypothetical protein
MNAGDAAWWDARIGARHAFMRRADRYWTWTILLPVLQLIQLRKRRFCRALVLWARADNGGFVRSGMSMFIEDYPYLGSSTAKSSEFVWFISAADPEVLATNFRMTRAPSLARIMLDMGIVLSQNAGFSGRIGLHAATAGGEDLLNLYSHCGLLRLPAAAAFPQAIRRKNDGRFFYADEIVAETMAALLDPDR